MLRGFQLACVRYFELVRAGKASKRCASVVVPTVLVGRRLKAR